MNKKPIGMLAVCGLLSSSITFAMEAPYPTENSAKALKAQLKLLKKKVKNGEQLTPEEQQQFDEMNSRKQSKKEQKNKIKMAKKKLKAGQQLTAEEQQLIEEANARKQEKRARKMQRNNTMMN